MYAEGEMEARMGGLEFSGFSVHREELQGCPDPTELNTRPSPLPFRGCPAPTGGSVRAVATGPVLPLHNLEQGISPPPRATPFHLHNGHQCQLPHRPVLGFHELTDVAGFTKGIVSHR